ncbi:MAG: FtsX-like permease family protein [Firmicutes bacterium]|nr:FtsX-like permease family protein [Bacillota bacterium]
MQVIEMRVRDNLWVAFGALLGNPLRSFLTALGVVIGVGAVIVMVSIGEGARARVTEQIQSLGSNLLMIAPGRMERGAWGSRTVLTSDLVPVVAACPSISRVAPEASGMRQVSFGEASIMTNITGVTADYWEVRKLKIGSGTLFGEEEVREARKVAVIGADVATELFPHQDPIGQKIKVGRVKFTVIGVAAPRGQAGFFSQDDVVYIPLTTAQRRLFGNKRIRMIYAEARSEELMDQAAAEIREALLAELEDENAFVINNQADILSTAQQMTQTLTLLLAGIAGVSLLVGGIGIMNIMLVSVTERIKEIGLRKALGAQEKEIMTQFLYEAATLSLLGGGIGFLLGSLGAAGLSAAFGWRTVISPSAVVVAFGLSLFVGIFFGVYPAGRASRLDPIEALRHE